MMRIVLAMLLLFTPFTVFAQSLGAGGLLVGPQGPAGVTPDMSAYALVAQVPAPAAVIPQSEAVGGSVGSSTTYMRSDAKLPRISRTMTVTTVTGGTFSGTWATALNNSPVVILTPVATGSAAITCELTALPTTTTFAGRCWTSQSTVLSLSIVTAGITVAPNTNSAAGISVQVTALPPTQ